MRKRRENTFGKQFMVWFMAFLMVGSLFAVVFFGFSGGGTAVERYGDYRFRYVTDHWETTIDNKVAAFTYYPTDIDDIEIAPEVSQRLRSTVQFDVTSDVNDSYAEGIALAQFQMGLTLSNFQLFMRSAFTDENEFGAPVMTCGDSTPFVPVIYIRESNQTAIYLEGDCIIADAQFSHDVIRVKDRLVYDILGIMQ